MPVDQNTLMALVAPAFTIALPAGPAPLDKTHPPRVVIDEQELVGPAVQEKWRASFRKEGGKWTFCGCDSEGVGPTSGG